MNSKELLKRNMPVFFIGALTIFIFIVIIITATGRNNKATTLIEVTDQELIAPHTYVKGPAGSKVTLVEFTDFGCPACKTLHPIVKAAFDKYSEYIRYGVRHFPLPQHENSDKASIAAQVAGEQGKFWEYSDLLFEYQGKFSEEELVQNADILGLDVEKFRNDLKNEAFKSLVDQDVRYGRQIGVNSTPTFFVNGKQVVIREEADLERAIVAALRENGIDPDKIVSKAEVEKVAAEKAFVESVQQIIDMDYGTTEISYTAENGFEPQKVDVKAGQLVRWTNNSEGDITFEQLIPRFDELNKPFVIKAGETFEFRMLLREGGLWTYDVKETEQTGSIYISRLPDELVKQLPEGQ